jgi:WS/DGAT/MGAT family acyltransferase
VPIDRLCAEDVQILKLEAGAIRGHTCKVLVLERCGERPLPTLRALREHISARLDAAPRLRQRLVATPLRVAHPVWLDDPEFEIERHVTRVEMAEPASRDALEPIVASLMAERLDRAHPLWHLDVVEQLEHDSMALIWRVHHCLADGTTCVRLASAVLWSAGPDEPSPAPSSWRPHPDPSATALLALGLKARVGQVRRLRPGSRPQLPSPLRARTTVRRELARGAALTPLAERVGSTRDVAFALAPLDDCKRVGKAIDEAVTLNDVVLSILAGGVRAWLDHGMRPVEGIRVKVPVSLHHGENDEFGNRDSYFFVDLPVAEADPAKRVLAINQETCERKLGHDAETLYRLGLHPFFAHWAMSPHIFTFNISNVHGPSNDVFVCGARIRELYSLAEIAQRHALRVAVISAAGKLFFGLCADREAVRDLDVLADGLRRSTDELLRLGR